MMRQRQQQIAVYAGLALALGLTAGCGQTDTVPPRAVEHKPHVHTADRLLADDLHAARLLTVLKTDPLTRDAEIQLVVTQGRARLSGFVENAAIKLRAGELILQAEGISAVDNRLILRYHAGDTTAPLADVRVRL